MIWKRALLALAFFLASCATNSADRTFGRFIGEDIHYATLRLGKPDAQPTIDGDEKHYVWTSNPEIELSKEISSGSAGGGLTGSMMAGGLGGASPSGVLAGGGGARPSSWTDTESVHLKCTVQIVTDQNNRIKSYELSGNQFCSKYYANLFKSFGR